MLTTFTDKEILIQFDKIFKRVNEPYIINDQYYEDSFIDLEDTRLKIHGNKIHLFSNDFYWAAVFELNGYSFSSGFPEINLIYIGNCIEYKKTGDMYSNLITLYPIKSDEIQNIAINNDFIRKDVVTVDVNGHNIKLEQDENVYKKLGIELDDYDNDKRLISFDNFIEYLNKMHPNSIFANDSLIKENLSQEIPKIMTINQYHYTSIYDGVLPSNQELFNLIASILVTRDTTLWKPLLIPNNKSSKWESGIE